MEEAVLLSGIQTLESRLVEESAKYSSEPYWEELDGLINELRMIVDFLRDKKLREGSRLYYLIGDLVEIINDLRRNRRKEFNQKIKSVRSWVVEAKMHMLQSGADGAEVENFGEGEDEDVVGLEEDEDVVGSEEDEDVVGLEKDVKLLLQKAINNEERQFRTVSITGMGGIGKTTLVRKVYNHADVVDRFERRAWVCVSSVFSHTEVLIKLIQQVVDRDELQRMEKMERAGNASLQEMLRQHLKGMRYVIVLDDLQKGMRLKSILEALPHEDKGSRLLLISRSHNIDAFVHYNHQTKPLDAGKSWKLFVKTIFRGTSEHKLSKQLEGKGERDVDKMWRSSISYKRGGKAVSRKEKVRE